jgi:acetolactate synthase-1/2/3 large subunit
MSGMELMTAIQYSATPIIIIFNNSSYGTIRMHQEREHPGRVIATDLVNPDFKKMAESMGVYSEIIKNTEEFLPAFRRCLKQKTACLLELKTDIYQLSSRFTLNS